MRDRHVTGVQTCALPTSPARPGRLRGGPGRLASRRRTHPPGRTGAGRCRRAAARQARRPGARRTGADDVAHRHPGAVRPGPGGARRGRDHRLGGSPAGHRVGAAGPGGGPVSEAADAPQGDQRRPQSVYSVGTEPDARFSLANERTALAWLRTGLALVAGGVALTTLASFGAGNAFLDVIAALACVSGGVLAHASAAKI